MILERVFVIALCGLTLGCDESAGATLDGRHVGLDIGFVDQTPQDADPADLLTSHDDGDLPVDQPGVPNDASVDQPGVPTDASVDQPGVPNDASVDQPSVPVDTSVDQPSVPADTSVDQPSIPPDTSVDQPSIPPDTSVDATADSAISLPACSTLLDPATVALYTFETGWGSKRAIDETGDHHGSLVDGPVKTTGTTDCGDGVSFPDPSYATLPASSDWDLAVGSISFWVRFAANASSVSQGIISRDASTSQGGHITITREASQGLITLRMQDASGASYFFCSEAPVPVDTWTEIAINFGPPQVELYIDGVRSTRSDTITIDNGTPLTVSCNPTYAGGLTGNNEPWLLGASASSSGENSVLPLRTPMTGGAIDHLRISSMRRNFTR